MLKRFLALLACTALPVSALAQASFTPDPATVNRDAAARGANYFATALYGQLRGQSGNLFFSPGSISTSMTMVYAGARENTANEMARALHLTMPPDQLHPAMGTLVRAINASGAMHGYSLSMINALWLQQGYGFNPEFTTLVQEDYGAALNHVNFSLQPDDARSRINAWVADQTAQRIRQLVPLGMITSMTRMVLTNTVYFKGDWQVPFDPAATIAEPFELGSHGMHADTPMMHRTGPFSYFQGMDFQAIQIPYKGRQLAMVVLLPGAADGLPALEREMTPITLAQWCEKLDNTGTREVQVALPKFTVETSLSLAPTLSAMGMRSAFLPEEANFSGLTDTSKAADPLFLSAVLHKAYIAVDEEGTEAAAATAVVAAPTGISQAVAFRADHPFIFLIRDVGSGAILFMGRVVNPTES